MMLNNFKSIRETLIAFTLQCLTPRADYFQPKRKTAPLRPAFSSRPSLCDPSSLFDTGNPMAAPMARLGVELDTILDHLKGLQSSLSDLGITPRDCAMTRARFDGELFDHGSQWDDTDADTAPLSHILQEKAPAPATMKATASIRPVLTYTETLATQNALHA